MRLPLPALIAAALVAASAAVVFVVPWDHAVYVAVTAPGASTVDCLCEERPPHASCACGPPGGPGVLRCDCTVQPREAWCECQARCLGWACRGDVCLLSAYCRRGEWGEWACAAGNATARCRCGSAYYEHNGTVYYRGTRACRCAVEVGGRPAVACPAFGCAACRFEAYAPCEGGPLQLGEREWCPVANATGFAIPVEPGWIVRVECLR